MCQTQLHIEMCVRKEIIGEYVDACVHVSHMVAVRRQLPPIDKYPKKHWFLVNIIHDMEWIRLKVWFGLAQQDFQGHNSQFTHHFIKKGA